MKPIIGNIASWALYGLGHAVSRPMTWWHRGAWLYPAYNWLMLKSVAAQDWGGGDGAWKQPGEMQ